MKPKQDGTAGDHPAPSSRTRAPWLRLLSPNLIQQANHRGNKISGDDGLAGMGRLQEGLRRWLLEAYHELQPFCELGTARKEPKLGGPAQ